MRMTFYLKPISTNHAVKTMVRNGVAIKYKSKEAKEFENEFQKQWQQFKMEARTFKNSFDESKHSIKFCASIEIPNLYKKGKSINKKSVDIDNCLKYLQDCIFKNLQIDDAFITELHAYKMHGDKFRITCTVDEIINTCH